MSTGEAALALPAWSYGAMTILGMAAVTALSRGFFLWSRRDVRLPAPQLERATMPTAARASTGSARCLMCPMTLMVYVCNGLREAYIPGNFQY